MTPFIYSWTLLRTSLFSHGTFVLRLSVSVTQFEESTFLPLGLPTRNFFLEQHECFEQLDTYLRLHISSSHAHVCSQCTSVRQPSEKSRDLWNTLALTSVYHLHRSRFLFARAKRDRCVSRCARYTRRASPAKIIWRMVQDVVFHQRCHTDARDSCAMHTKWRVRSAHTLLHGIRASVSRLDDGGLSP